MFEIHLSRWRLEISALVFIIYLVNTCSPAPTQENRILRHTDGCYYNYNHYGEGDRIQTNEPCLNCTCHNQMLMCYLRVCPFTKPIDHDCIIEKREDQCCPIITCPEVPVQLMDNQVPSTDIGLPERTGCIIDDKFYPEGRQVPSNPNKPCELCYCIRNKTSCIMQECTLHIDGCQPIYNKGSCCPVRYNCDNEIENELLLEEDTTTTRPTPGFMITTPLSYLGTKECIHNGVTYSDGSIIESDRPCEHCYCMKGDIVCAVQECAHPMGVDKQNCISSPSPDDLDHNECCPKVIHCDDVMEEQNRTITELPEFTKVLTTTISPSEDISTTHQPSWDDNLIDGISSEDIQLQEHINEDGHKKESEFDGTAAASATTVSTSNTNVSDLVKMTEDKEKHIITTPQDTSYSHKMDTHTESILPSFDFTSKSSTTEDALLPSDLKSKSPTTESASDLTSKSSTTEGTMLSLDLTSKSLTTEGTEAPLDLFSKILTTEGTLSSSDLVSKFHQTTEYLAKDLTTMTTIVKSTEESISTESDEKQQYVPSGSNVESTDFASPIVNEIPDSIPGEGFCLVKGVTYKSYESIINDCNLPCICLNSLIVCKSNCNKSPSCPNLGESIDSCCNSLKCDYDIIEPIDVDETTLSLEQQSTIHAQQNINLTSFSTMSASTISSSSGSSTEIVTEKDITEKLDTFGRKETSKPFEPSAITTEFYREMSQTSTNSPHETTLSTSHISETIKETEIKYPAMDSDLSISENETKQETGVENTEGFVPLETSSSSSPPPLLEMEFISTPEQGMPDFITEYSSNESHPFESFSIRDSITEKEKFEKHTTTEASLEEDHSSSSSTMRPEVLTDFEKKTTLSAQKDLLDQASTTFRGSSSTSISEMIEKVSSEIPMKEHTTPAEEVSKDDEIIKPEEYEVQKYATTLTYPEISSTEFSISDLMQGVEVNETDVKKIDKGEDEVKSTEVPEIIITTSEQRMSTESTVTKVRKDDEMIQMSSESALDAGMSTEAETSSSEPEIPAQEHIVITTESDSFVTVTNVESSSPSFFMEYDKTSHDKTHEDGKDHMELTTERDLLASAIPQETTPLYDIQNDTILEDMKTEKSEAQDLMNEVIFDVTTSSSSVPNEIYDEITLKSQRISTESPETEDTYQSSIKDDKVKDFIKTSVSEVTTSKAMGEEQEKIEHDMKEYHEMITEQQELELLHDTKATEKQEEVEMHPDTYTEVQGTEMSHEIQTEKPYDLNANFSTEKSEEMDIHSPVEKLHELDLHFSTEKPDELDGHYSTEKAHDFETHSSTEKVHDFETHSYTEKVHDLETHSSTEKMHDLETYSSTEKVHDLETYSSTEKVHDLETYSYTEKVHDLETHSSTEKVHDLETYSSTEKVHDLETQSSTGKEEELEQDVSTKTEKDETRIHQDTITEGSAVVEEEQHTKAQFEISSSTTRDEEHEIGLDEDTTIKKQELEVPQHIPTETPEEGSGTHRDIFEDVTESKRTETTIIEDIRQTPSKEPEKEQHENDVLVHDKLTTLSQFEPSTTIKMIEKEIMEQQQTTTALPSHPSSILTSTTVSFVPHDMHQNTTEGSLIIDSKTTEHAIPMESVEDLSQVSTTQKSSLPSSHDYFSTKTPSYQQNPPPQLPPHYPSYSEDDYNEEEESESFGPGTCRYGGKLFVSAQQIPRDDPCDFCFCFRSDIICLQQSCPPPISGCHEEPIQGFCCPRYECPVSMAAQLNITTSTTTTTTIPPLMGQNLLSGEIIQTGCYIGGKSYKVGDRVDSTSGPCMNCRCGGDGQMKCEPKPCTPEPMLRQMIAVVSSRRR